MSLRFRRTIETISLPMRRPRPWSRGITLSPVANLEEELRLLGFDMFRRDPEEFRLCQDLSRDAVLLFRGERALIPAGPQLDAARALYTHNASDWGARDEQVGAYIRTSLKRDRRSISVGLAVGVPAIALAGYAAREVHGYIDSLHRTRIAFDNVSVPGPNYAIAAGPYLRRFGVGITSRMPDNSAVLIASNIAVSRRRMPSMR